MNDGSASVGTSPPGTTSSATSSAGTGPTAPSTTSEDECVRFSATGDSLTATPATGCETGTWGLQLDLQCVEHGRWAAVEAGQEWVLEERGMLGVGDGGRRKSGPR